MWRYILIACTLMVTLSACQEEFSLDEVPPTTDDATFTITEDARGGNYLVFTNDAEGFIKQWDFGNGNSAEGDVVTAYYPFEGTYTVTLTIYAAGGSIVSTSEVTVDETDPEICNVEILRLLTGGCDAVNGKTWVIDAGTSGHFGLGPITSFGPDWYQAVANEKTGGGLYNDRYTFILNESVFIQETNGDVYLNGGQADNFPGAEPSDVGDFTAPYDTTEGLNFALTEDADNNQFINLTQQAFIGYATGVSRYQILSISENEMFIRFTDATNTEFAWYHRLITEGFTPVNAGFTFEVSGTTVTFTNTSSGANTYEWDFGDGNSSTEESPSHTYAEDGTFEVTLTVRGDQDESTVTQSVTVSSSLIELPFTFEGLEPVWSDFGGNSHQYINNPDPSGLNTSGRVLEVVHGNEPWAGASIDLTEGLDFADGNVISLKVWAPQAGDFRLKLENTADADDFIQMDQPVTATNQWVELQFDISGAAGKAYRRLVIFPGWDIPNASTYYVDDIQKKVATPFTFEAGSPQFSGFGGSSFAIIDNPDMSGINTSAKVLETVHGNEPWAGLSTDLTDNMDLRAGTTVTLKVWAPATGDFRLKLENVDDSNDFVQIDMPVNAANEWVEVTWDVSDAAGKPYKRLVIFPGWDVPNAGTFYVDDIRINN